MEFTVDFAIQLILIICTFFYIIYIGFDFIIKKKKRTFIEYFILFSFFIYLGGVSKEAIFPFTLFLGSAKPHFISHFSDYYELIPFKSTIDSIRYGLYIQSIGNVALLFPLGIYLGLFRPKASFKKITLYIFLTSLGIETFQLLIDVLTRYVNRVFDTSDLILNVLGGIIGWAILKIFYQYLPNFIKSSFIFENHSQRHN